MVVITLDCPHCKSQRMTFDFNGESVNERFEFIDEGKLFISWNTFFTCRSCREGVVVKLVAQDNGHKPSDCAGDPRKEGFSIGEMHPKPEGLNVPEFLPPRVDEEFREGADGLKHGNYNSAGIMFRRALERATDEIMKDEAKGKTLFERIRILGETRKITEAMQEWADAIRIGGNRAAHEEQRYDNDSATQLRNFTEMFLTYAFTLPERVKAFRKSSK